MAHCSHRKRDCPAFTGTVNSQRITWPDYRLYPLNPYTKAPLLLDVIDMSSNTTGNMNSGSGSSGAGRGGGRGGAGNRGGRGGGASGGARRKNNTNAQAGAARVQARLNNPAASAVATTATTTTIIAANEPATNALLSGTAALTIINNAEVGDGDDEEDVCWLCAEPVKFYSVAECNHRTCHVCAVRLRALYKKMECTFCKVSQSVVLRNPRN